MKLQKDFKYAAMQNAEKSDAVLIAALQNVVKHNFGEHNGCSASWCHALKSDSKVAAPKLPYGRYLQGDRLRAGLTIIVAKWSDKGHLERLRSSGSSQANESFHVSAE